NRLVQRLICDNRGDGTKYFFLGNPHVITHILKHGRFGEIVLRQSLWLAVATDQNRCALVHACLNIALNTVVLLVSYKWAHLIIFLWIADFQVSNELFHFFLERRLHINVSDSRASENNSFIFIAILSLKERCTLSIPFIDSYIRSYLCFIAPLEYSLLDEY